jgi:dTDP-4-dehydrorhamnose reductase
MRILITGASGRLSQRLNELLRHQHDMVLPSKAELDITDYRATMRYIVAHNPDLVIHAAAWTDVDGCAREPDRAIQVNGYGTQHVALASAKAGAALLYISSNEVFDGTTGTPYREYDRTNPANPYGYSKWVGEQTALAHNPQTYIVRTAWLFAHGGRNFIQTIMNAVAAGRQLRVVINEVANPTYTDDLAEAITKLIVTERYGIYHFVNEGACSRWAFARYILDQAGMSDTHAERILSYEWQRASQPPEHSVLVNSAGASIGITLRPWQAAVDAFLEKEGLYKPR